MSTAPQQARTAPCTSRWLFFFCTRWWLPQASVSMQMPINSESHAASVMRKNIMANPAWSILCLWWLHWRACAWRATELQLASRLSSLSRCEHHMGRITQRVQIHINRIVTHVQVYTGDWSSHLHYNYCPHSLNHNGTQVQTRNYCTHVFLFCWQITLDYICAVMAVHFCSPPLCDASLHLHVWEASCYFSSVSHALCLLWDSLW